MQYVQSVMESDGVQALVNENDAIINDIVNKTMSSIVTENISIARSNVEFFIAENDILETYEDISTWANEDVQEYMEAISMVLSDSGLTQEDKIAIISNPDQFIVEAEIDEKEAEAFRKETMANRKAKAAKPSTQVKDRTGSGQGGTNASQKTTGKLRNGKDTSVRGRLRRAGAAIVGAGKKVAGKVRDAYYNVKGHMAMKKRGLKSKVIKGFQGS